MSQRAEGPRFGSGVGIGAGRRNVELPIYGWSRPQIGPTADQSQEDEREQSGTVMEMRLHFQLYGLLSYRKDCVARRRSNSV